MVVASGSGTSPGAAEKAALHAAVEKGVGAYLNRELVLENDQLQERVHAVSRGFVERYDVLVPAYRILDGLWEVKIRAWVRVSAAAPKLPQSGAVVEGHNAWAQAVTQTRSRDEAESMLKALLPDLVPRLVQLIPDPSPSIYPDRQTGHNRILWKVACTPSREWWAQEALPVLSHCFDILSLDPPLTMAVTRTPDAITSNHLQFYIQEQQQWVDLLGYRQPIPPVHLSAQSIGDGSRSGTDNAALFVTTGRSLHSLKRYHLPSAVRKMVTMSARTPDLMLELRTADAVVAFTRFPAPFQILGAAYDQPLGPILHRGFSAYESHMLAVEVPIEPDRIKSVTSVKVRWIQ